MNDSPPPVPQRADAQRNRATLLKVAGQAMRAGEGALTGSELAQRAGLGKGTVYRHFASRDALVAAVFADAIQEVIRGLDELLAVEEPASALQHFLHALVESSSTCPAWAEALDGTLAGSSPAFAHNHGELENVIAGALAAGVLSGSIRGGVDSKIVMRTVSGIATPSEHPEWAVESHAVVDLVIRGLSAPESRLDSSPQGG